MKSSLGENIRVVFHDVDTNTTKLTNVNSTNWIDCKDVLRGQVILFRTVGTGRIRSSGLYVSRAATGTSAALVNTLNATTRATGSLLAANGSIALPGVGRIVINFNRDDLVRALEEGRYICARIENDMSTDEMGCLYILEMKAGYQNQFVTGNDNT